MKVSTAMAILFSGNNPHPFSEAELSPSLASREQRRRKQIVSVVLLVIILFQLIDLPGAIMSRDATSIGIALLGLALCGLALVFNHFGRVTVVSILLILVVELGCGLMLLTSPMGLDVGDLPVFDVLIVSLLIAVSLLPAVSVFPVALSNILFIFAVLALMPRTPELNMMLSADMAYNTIVQPVSLQIVVAVVAYSWVRSALRAIARADRAEEIAQLQRREAELLRHEAERTRQLDIGSEHLLQVLVRAANGDRAVHANLPPDHLLWRVGNALNLLLTRLRRANQTAYEIQQLREANARLTQRAYEEKVASQQARNERR